MLHQIGQACGWFTTIAFSISFLPQIFHTYKLKRVNQVSFGMWLTTVVGYATALVYGISLREAILIVGYGWGLGCSIIYLALYFKYRKIRKKVKRVSRHI